MNETGKTDELGQLRYFLERLSALVSVLAAVGYVSLRSFANFVGLAGLQGLTVEQLLFECYSVAAAFMIVASPMICGAVIIYGIIGLATSWINLRVSLLLNRAVIWYALLIVGSTVAAAMIIAVLASLTPDVLVRSVSDISMFRQRRVVYVAVVGATLCTAAMLRWSYFVVRDDFVAGALYTKVVRALLCGLIIFFTWASAIVFNVHFRGLEFPVAKVGNGNNQQSCGLLVYSTEKRWFLWQVSGAGISGRGTIRAVARDERDQLTLFPSRSAVDAAKDALNGKPALPECESEH